MDEVTLWTEEKIITKAVDDQQKNFLNNTNGNFKIYHEDIFLFYTY